MQPPPTFVDFAPRRIRRECGRAQKRDHRQSQPAPAPCEGRVHLPDTAAAAVQEVDEEDDEHHDHKDNHNQHRLNYLS
jgi:hypothetical protein